MTKTVGDRSISIGGNVTGAAFITGDHNTSTVTYTAPPPPAPESVDPGAELAALRSLLAQFRTADAAKLTSALDIAAGELAKPEPDREDVGTNLVTIGKVVRKAENAADLVERLAPHVTALSAWLGPLGKAVLAAFGVSF